VSACAYTPAYHPRLGDHRARPIYAGKEVAAYVPKNLPRCGAGDSYVRAETPPIRRSPDARPSSAANNDAWWIGLAVVDGVWWEADWAAAVLLGAAMVATPVAAVTVAASRPEGYAGAELTRVNSYNDSAYEKRQRCARAAKEADTP
jgi:hypothetical protein